MSLSCPDSQIRNHFFEYFLNASVCCINHNFSRYFLKMFEHFSCKFIFIFVIITEQPLPALLFLLFLSDPLVQDISLGCQLDGNASSEGEGVSKKPFPAVT